MAKSKSAYSIPSKLSKSETHIIVVWVDNEASVLSRVVGLFSGRGYNIESLAVAEVDQKNNLSRITIVTTGTPEVIEQIVLQLKKLVPVHKVGNFKREDKKVIFKEMALGHGSKKLEDLLGLDRGALGNNPVRIDVDNPTGLRMPDGNELRANNQWIPGGVTSGGVDDVIIKTEGMQEGIDFFVKNL